MDYAVRTPTQLASILAAFRKQRGLSQAELAQRLGITQQALSELEREPQTASTTRVMQYCAMLGVEMVFRDYEDVAKASSKSTPKARW